MESSTFLLLTSEKRLKGISMSCPSIFFYLSINGLYVLFINVCPCDVHGLHEFSITGMKILYVNVCPLDVRDYVDVTSESGLPGTNGLGMELALNGLNGLNGLGPESAKEQPELKILYIVL